MMSYENYKILPKRTNAASSDTLYPLSPEQLKFYEDNGYLVIKKLIGLPALNTYRERFTDICNGRLDRHQFSVIKDYALYKAEKKPEDYIYKIQELLYDDVYSTYSEDPRLLHVLAQLIGENITAINLTVINKPPGTGEHPAHQDGVYFPFRPLNKIIGTWTAIDPVNKENGCLFMIPGSHKNDILYEHAPQKGQVIRFNLTEEKISELAPENKRVYLEMEPGDTVFFGTTIIHGSRPNVSKMYRKCIACHCASSYCYYIDPNGTIHEEVARAIEADMKRRGGDFGIIEFWKVKAKQLSGFRCNL